MYVVRIVAYQDYRDRCRPHKRRNWIFTHVRMCNIIIVEEVEVHGWLLSGIAIEVMHGAWSTPTRITVSHV